MNLGTPSVAATVPRIFSQKALDFGKLGLVSQSCRLKVRTAVLDATDGLNRLGVCR